MSASTQNGAKERRAAHKSAKGCKRASKSTDVCKIANLLR